MRKCEYLENEKSFLDQRKSIFDSYLRTIFWRKNEKQRTQALNFLFEARFLCQRNNVDSPKIYFFQVMVFCFNVKFSLAI